MSKRSVVVAVPDRGTATKLLPMLSAIGLAPLSAGDGVEAIRLVDRERPVMVIAETELDVVDGFELCKRLRNEASTRSIAILLLGPGDERETRLAALTAGADEFLLKPIDPEEARLRLAMMMHRVGRLSGVNGDRPPTGAEEEQLPPDVEAERHLYARLVAGVNEVLAQVSKDITPSLAFLEEASRELVERSASMVALALDKRDVTDLAAHHVNVAIIATILARELELSEEELQRTALLALVHDLGLAKIPESIVYAPRRLTAVELHQVKEHPRYTCEILVAAGHRELGELALQEHEREKGQGYPRGLRGPQIHELAKIIGVADVYEACTHPRSYDRTLTPYDTMQMLIEMRDEYFPARHIKALMQALTVYPVGSYVQLNTGEIGRVQSTSRKNLMRPVVEIFWDSKHQPLASTKTVNLAESPFLFVSKSLYEDGLPGARIRRGERV